MKLVAVVAFSLLLVAVEVLGQDAKVSQRPSANSQAQAASWQRYTVREESFSVELPAHPAMSTGERSLGYRRSDQRREILLGAYAEGVVYMIYTLQNDSPEMSFKDFCKGIASRAVWDPDTEQKLTLSGVSGRQYYSPHALGGTVQLFSGFGRLYRFQAFGAPPDDPRVKQFFSSIVFSEKEDGIRVSDGVGVPFMHTGQLEPNIDPTVFKSKEVDRKALVIIKPEPRYTTGARRGQITGTVVLRVVFAADGTVTDIDMLSGLPDGLTERAIDAAKKIKFIPAMKDGKFVSMRIQLEYNFNLY